MTGPSSRRYTTIGIDNTDLSLVSAFQKCTGGGTAGPDPIPAVGTPVTVGLQVPGVPAISHTGLAALAVALALDGMAFLRR